MGKQHLHLLFRLLFGLVYFPFSACDTTINTDEAEIADAVVVSSSSDASTKAYTVDTATSIINWIGAKMTGRHNGVFRILDGEVHMTDSLLAGAKVVIDVASIKSTDKTIDAESNLKLTTELRSPDFFDVTQYPTAAFEFTSASRINAAKEENTADATGREATYRKLRIQDPTHRITGNLTIKGETKSITFPARITLDTLLRVRANFNIDRTKWGLVYRSDKSLGDKTIHPEVNIGIDLVAKPE
jgi:polyisoprenoid-binding protein YceI